MKTRIVLAALAVLGFIASCEKPVEKENDVAPQITIVKPTSGDTLKQGDTLHLQIILQDDELVTTVDYTLKESETQKVILEEQKRVGADSAMLSAMWVVNTTAQSLVLNISVVDEHENTSTHTLIIPINIPIPSRYSAFISNEGLYNRNNSSVTVKTSSGYLLKEYYAYKNGASPGDILQSMSTAGGKTFLILNNSAKVEVVGNLNFDYKGVITDGMDYPRNFYSANGLIGYISNGSQSGDIKVIDINNLSVIQTIPVGYGPEKMTHSGDNLFVLNTGGWSKDSTVSIVSMSSNSLLKTIEVGDKPVDIVTDANDDIWVLNAGVVLYDENWVDTGSTAAGLSRIDGTTLGIEFQTQLGELGDHPSQMEISPDGTILYYYMEGKLYSHNIFNNSVRQILAQNDVYGLSVSPNGDIYVCITGENFVGEGRVDVYDADGVFKETIPAGIAPNGVLFVKE